MSQNVLEMSAVWRIVPTMAIVERSHTINGDDRLLELVPNDHTSFTANEVMTAREVADLLHLPLSTVYHLAREGQLPAKRFGRTWRFLRPRLEELLWE